MVVWKGFSFSTTLFGNFQSSPIPVPGSLPNLQALKDIPWGGGAQNQAN